MPLRLLHIFVLRVLAGVALMFTVMGACQADVIFQAKPFSIAGATGLMQSDAFNPAIGDLDKVHVSITGQFSFDVSISPGQTVAPIVTLNVRPLTGGFGLLNDILLYLPQVTNTDACGPYDPCASIIAPFAAVFSLSFDLTASSDLVGITTGHTDAGGPITPAFIEARRADFIEGSAPLPIMEMMDIIPFSVTPLGGYIGGGVVQTSYYYTPIGSAGEPGGGSSGGGTAVSEPATAALFALAPGLMLWRRRRGARTCSNPMA